MKRQCCNAVAVVIITVFVYLPTATQCDTSYYEKYYSARRFLPPKRPVLLSFEFTVRLEASEHLASHERIALTGNIKQMGAWRPDAAVMLNRSLEHNMWQGRIQLPMNTSVNYRYFIAVEQSSGSGPRNGVQIRRWESHIQPRSFNTTTVAGNRSDIFGWIAHTEREVQRGWLNAGKLLQFKLFRDPFELNERMNGSEQLRIKLQPVEPQRLTPILPSARAETEYVRMEYGNSYLRQQPEFGVPYALNDILIFQTTVSELQHVAYLMQLYVTQQGSELVRLVGYQYIFPQVLTGTEGEFTINLVSPNWLNAIGTLRLQYLIIEPMPNASVDFRTTFTEYWRSNWTALEAGHRGLGKSLSLATNAPPVIENTVASAKLTGELGADMVEFDVMLTSDLVPIIYHDYSIRVCMDPKTPTSKDDLTEVLIKDVTYEQLKNLKTYQVVGNNKIVEYPAHNAVKEEDQRLFPLFEDYLTKINKSVGFDIEVKWPQLQSNGQYESNQTIDKNVYVDRILAVMQRRGCGRLSIFSSFDADICTLLRFKQNMYPVMFLSSKEPTYADPRTDTILDTINTAQAFDLAGIAPNSAHIKADAGWIKLAFKQQQKVFIWGSELKDAASIKWFRDQDPTGVIYDRMDLWLPAHNRSAFESENDLPGFFQLQCSPKQKLSEGNKTIESILSNVNLL